MSMQIEIMIYFALHYHIEIYNHMSHQINSVMQNRIFLLEQY
jgi:hypothetical protein